MMTWLAPASAARSGPTPTTLWNSRAAAYLVKRHEAWGIQLNWYTVNGSLPPPDTQPPPAPGIKHLVVYNCTGNPDFPTIDPVRPLSLWVRDATTGGAFTGATHAVNNWSGNSCGPSAFSGQPFTYDPRATGHLYVIQAVDYTLPGCTDDPLNGGSNNCLPSTITILGDTAGLQWQTTVTPGLRPTRSRVKRVRACTPRRGSAPRSPGRRST